jgi:hypothetical protein
MDLLLETGRFGRQKVQWEQIAKWYCATTRPGQFSIDNSDEFTAGLYKQSEEIST